VITRTCVTMKGDQEERLLGMSQSFPYSAVYGDLYDYVGGYVPWHWHEAIEVIYIVQGDALFYVGDERFHLGNGDALFVNGNSLHMLKPVSESGHVIFHTLLFDAGFLSGRYGSVFEQKYVSPILSCQNISGVKFQSGDRDHERMIGLLRDAYVFSEKESFGYEFKIRDLLSQAWLLVWEASKAKLIPGKVRNDQSAERAKIMLSYIHGNYMKRIELKDIASSANVGERECLRCFKKALSMSPFEYLTHYRIRFAAGMLVNSDETVTNIGEAAGFSSSSYFGKKFRILMGCTPRKYRGKGGTLP
jgi:AraC-like DNA-binding protein/mannose-6-phosphate isomerase-like protein (cupin superfamily)